MLNGGGKPFRSAFDTQASSDWKTEVSATRQRQFWPFTTHLASLERSGQCVNQALIADLGPWPQEVFRLNCLFSDM